MFQEVVRLAVTATLALFLLAIAFCSIIVAIEYKELTPIVAPESDYNPGERLRLANMLVFWGLVLTSANLFNEELIVQDYSL